MSIRWPWRGRVRDHLPELHLRSRAVRLAQTLRGEPDIRLIAPDAATVLAQAACVLGERVEALRHVVRQLTEHPTELDGFATDSVSSASDIVIIEEAAQRASTTHMTLCERLVRQNKGAPEKADNADRAPDQAAEAILEPERSRFAALRRVTRGRIWQESLIGTHLADGILRDVYERLAIADDSFGAATIIAPSTTDSEGIGDILSRETRTDPELASRLALFGRRLVGDVVLVARGSLRLGEASTTEKLAENTAHADALLSLVIAAHSRRMSAFGLTA